jgi:class 3 adenylate cyclase
MQKKMLTIFIVLVAITNVYSDPGKEGQFRIDSLLGQLKRSEKDTVKINLLNDLAYTYSFINLDDALNYANRALALSKELAWERGVAYSNLNLVRNYILKTEYSKALIDGKLNLIQFEKLEDEKGFALAHLNIAGVELYLANYSIALENLLKALSIFEKLGSRPEIARTLSEMVWVYSYQSNFTEARELGFKSFKINEELGNRNGMAISLNALGSSYYVNDDYDNSLKYWLKALTISQELGNTRRIGVEMDNVGWSYYKLSKFPEALQYLKESLIINKQGKSKRGVCWDYIGVGGIYLEIVQDSSQKTLNDFFEGNRMAVLELAKIYTDSAISISKLSNHEEILMKAYQQFSLIQTLFGDYKGALISYQEFTKKKNVVYSNEKNTAITSMKIKHDQEKIDELKNVELARQKLIRNVVLVSLGFVLLFLVIVNRQRTKIFNEKKRSEALLLNILPEEIAQELKEKGHSDAQLIDQATVLFTDFKGFTAMSVQLSPKKLVEDLHACFSKFDHICEKYGIEKIKTIGDAYMAAGGLPTPNNNHAQNVVRAALEMALVVEQAKTKKIRDSQPFFEVKIGIHTGPVVAGIVGIKKYSYDIWGDTVNTASRMESSGEVGKVNVSQATYEILKEDSDFIFKSRGEIEAKGKGELEMWFVSIKT